MMSHSLRVHRRLSIEELEPRIAPTGIDLALSSTHNTDTATFTDSDLDTVRVTLTGQGVGKVHLDLASGASGNIVSTVFQAANSLTKLQIAVIATAGDGVTPAGDGAFLVRNSWGTGFGAGGYFWVSYYDRSFARDECTSYTRVDPLGTYRRNYQYDKLGWTSAWGFDQATCWGANRFTARGDGHIAAVGFYTRVAGTRYEVYAGKSLTRLKPRGTGTSVLPGYLTVSLTSRLAVRAGRHFVVAIRLVSPGETAADFSPMAIENPAAKWISGAVAAPGESFMSPNGRRWTDLNAHPGAQANVCLKAFAVR